MRIIIAPDSFKEAMTAAEAAAAMARGVRAVVPDADVVELPMSDGGEGFTEAVAASLGAEVRDVDAVDALGRPVIARIALADGTAVAEMASASGLEIISAEDRDVRASDTRGVGRLVRAALDAGATRLLLGIGGSATNDGGAGMLVELGARILDADGSEIGSTPSELERVASVDLSGLDDRLDDLEVDVACDVDNPLLGERGAGAVFGPQKGASEEDVAFLDEVLGRWAAASGHEDDADRPGAGAAGGLGFALLAFLGAELQPGIELVSGAVGLADAVEGAELVITGEGSVDAQTLGGKTPAGVAAVAKEAGVPTLIVAGRVKADADVLLDAGVVAVISNSQGESQDLATELANAASNTERSTATALRLWTHSTGRGH